MSETLGERPLVETKVRRPRVGFLGVGWIGRHRMEAALETDAIDAVGVADPSPEQRQAALDLAPAAAAAATLDELLAMDLDGLVIATPSALHAEQAIAALDRGVAVFCQKPLGRTAAEASAVVEAARRTDRFLAVDLSYRFTEGMQRIRRSIHEGEIGKAFAADLIFHNAYGPDKAWFYDRKLSGGGCVMDLGVHLVDLALWALDFPQVRTVTSSRYAGGVLLPRGAREVEDYAVATLETADGATVRLACSWRLHAGCEAQISASFYGTAGGAELHNVDGSFYDFTATRNEGVRRETLCAPPDAWGGRAIADWARRLAAGQRYDPGCARLAYLAAVLDRINDLDANDPVCAPSR